MAEEEKKLNEEELEEVAGGIPRGFHFDRAQQAWVPDGPQPASSQNGVVLIT